MEHKEILSQTTVDAVQELLSQHAFLQAFSDEVGVKVGSIDVATDDEVTKVAMPWIFYTDAPGIPALAKKFLPREVKVDWSQEWQANGTGLLRVDLHGSPSAVCKGEAALKQASADVDYTVKTSTKTSVPWPLGGTVESMINKDLVGWILSVQARVLRRELGG